MQLQSIEGIKLDDLSLYTVKRMMRERPLYTETLVECLDKFRNKDGESLIYLAIQNARRI